MGDELKPCPFCESANLRVASQDHDGRHGEETLWWIECSECSSAGPALPSRYEATEAWNRPTARAEAAEQRAEAVVADAQAAAHFAQSVAHLLASPGAEAEAVQHLRAADLPHLFDCLRERLAEAQPADEVTEHVGG